MASRRNLPTRRNGITIRVPHHMNPASQSFIVTIGHFPDCTPAEIFINMDGKQGTETGINVSDFAVVVSLALQYGCPLDTLVDAMRRNPNGDPTGLFAHILTSVRDEEERLKQERDK